MALGNNYDNNSNEVFRPTVYGYGFGNIGEGAVDQTNISFTMWKSTIKIAIAPQVKGGPGERTEWDRKAAACIYLTPIKALQFADIIKRFKEDPVTFNGWGVFAGKGLITISNGKAFGGSKPCIVVQTINQSGSVDSQYAYEFKTDYHKVLEQFDSETGEFVENTDMFKDIEMDQIIAQLKDYAAASDNAIAFSVVDNLSWTFHHQNNDIAAIAGKLGVDLGKQKASSTSYFNKPKTATESSASRQSGTMDAIING